ncbi:alpha/beta fold hydrolase [Sphingomonas morindae]|uniref:Alpha/beta hydrolase n=1 Tax=Sphingomonas morindae TaxID=1541170 RepID=A0ABY4X7U6_9SPHN|nr:alpha/beta hydrolase [Sphingomonas morindae]USI72970.1 alpha/beta hydrolase [Sphingomonas morindae]
MFIRSNGIDLHVQQRGAGLPALVFLHYWGGSSRTWHHVIDDLDDEFRTIAIDHRGWGKSDKPESGYALADLAADAMGVITEMALQRYILVGHSMGGKVAQRIAAQRPAGLKGLVLVAPSPPSPLGLPEEVRRGMVSAYATRESIIATVEQVLAPNGLCDADLEMVIEDSLRGAPAAIAAWPLATSQEDITALASRIEVPTIVISGEDDRVDPPAILRRELLPRVPQAQLHLLAGVGHLSPLEAPGAIADLVRTFARAVMPDLTAPASTTGR